MYIWGILFAPLPLVFFKCRVIILLFWEFGALWNEFSMIGNARQWSMNMDLVRVWTGTRQIRYQTNFGGFLVMLKFYILKGFLKKEKWLKFDIFGLNYIKIVLKLSQVVSLKEYNCRFGFDFSLKTDGGDAYQS